MEVDQIQFMLLSCFKATSSSWSLQLCKAAGDATFGILIFYLPEMHRLCKIGTFNMIVFDTFFCKANRNEAMNLLDISSLKATRDISKKNMAFCSLKNAPCISHGISHQKCPTWPWKFPWSLDPANPWNTPGWRFGHRRIRPIAFSPWRRRVARRLGERWQSMKTR